MLRQIFPLCFLLALCGCGEAPVTPAANGSKPTRETPVAVKPEGVATAKLGTPAREPEADAEELAAMADGAKSGEKSEEAISSDKELAVDEKKADDGAKGDDAKDDESKGPTTEEALAEARKAFQKGDMKGAIAELEKAVPSNPNDANLLLQLAGLNMNVAAANREKPEYGMYQKAADYFRRAIKVDPNLGENPGIRKFGGGIFYNEACALAVDKKTDEAMKALEAATEAGFSDFAQMEKDTDLEAIRALPEFSEFLAKAQEAYREHLKKEIDDLIAQTKPFDFDFELTDIEGNAIAKADFKGKVLIVDVWGTWCPPCRAEVPHFVALVKKFKEEGLEIVGLNSEGGDDAEALKKVQDFHKENGMNYRCALVKKDTVDQIPNMEGFPTTLFFDRTGKVRAKVVGLQDYEKLEAFVTRLLEEKFEEAGG